MSDFVETRCIRREKRVRGQVIQLKFLPAFKKTRVRVINEKEIRVPIGIMKENSTPGNTGCFSFPLPFYLRSLSSLFATQFPLQRHD